MPAVRIASNHLTGPLSRPVSSPVLPHPSGSSGPRGIGPAGCRGGACSGPGRGGLGTVMLRRRGGRQPGPGPGPGPADRARRIGAVARRRSRLWRPLGLLRSLVHVRPPRAVRFSVPLMGSILCDTQLLLQICCVRFATSAITRWLGERITAPSLSWAWRNAIVSLAPAVFLGFPCLQSLISCLYAGRWVRTMRSAPTPGSNISLG